MRIFIPYSRMNPIKPSVLMSLYGDIKTIDCTFDQPMAKCFKIVMAEYRFKEVALQEDCDLYVYHQSDILLIKKESLVLMQKFLNVNKNFGAVALSRFNLTDSPLVYSKENKLNMCSGCTMFTREGLEAVEFEDKSVQRLPSAQVIASSLLSAGLNYGFVDGVARIKHLI